jgi:glutathione transport system permease protein
MREGALPSAEPVVRLPSPAATARPARGLWSDAWRGLRRNRAAMAGGAVLVLLVVMAIAAPGLAPYEPAEQDYAHVLEGSSLAHPFGTDNFGRDIYSRVIYGARISLSLGVLGIALGLLVGLAIGLVAGQAGGLLDDLLMRLLDLLLAFPQLLLAIMVIAALGVGEVNVIVAIGLFSVPVFARVLRGQILSLKQREFALAARAIGAGSRRILLVHLLPNALASILVIASLRLGTAILTVATLSFLGLGIRPPAPEWGTMLTDGRQLLQVAPHVAIFPGLAIVVTVLAVNLLGDGLRDALDPRLTA